MRSLASLCALPFALALTLAGCSGSSSETDSESETGASDSNSSTSQGEDVMLQLCGSGEKTEGSATNLMAEWGAPCTTDDECVALIGDGASCLNDILSIYVLPMGYCAKLCSLPDDATKYVENDAACGDGRTCLGAKDFFEACAIPCTSDDECQRDGYTCQILPQIGEEGDPKFCLMQPECTQSCIDNPMQDNC
ncbi:MAG: hypothetical protein R3A79_19160 [Nannocystaceae bacterium]